MELTLPKGYAWDPSLRLGKETAELTARVWPNYLIAESDLPEPRLKFEISQQEFLRRFPAWGIRREDTGGLVAFANGVQLALDLSQPSLPEGGWQYAIQSADSKAPRNALCLLVANVDPTVRGLGLARTLVERAKLATLGLGFDTMIAPVRPTRKHESPFTPMDEYILKRTERGELYDPWLNLHHQAGGKIVNVCSESVCVRATLGKWREWTGLPLQASGDRLLPQGLVPLKVDTEGNVGTYSEPNVWVRYDL